MTGMYDSIYFIINGDRNMEAIKVKYAAEPFHLGEVYGFKDRFQENIETVHWSLLCINVDCLLIHPRQSAGLLVRPQDELGGVYPTYNYGGAE